MASFQVQIIPFSEASFHCKSKVGCSFALLRSKGTTSARGSWKLSSSYSLLPFLDKEKQENEEREEKALETKRLKEVLMVQAGQRIRLERELVAFRQEGRQQNEKLAELREEQRGRMGAKNRQDYFCHVVSSLIFLSLIPIMTVCDLIRFLLSRHELDTDSASL